MATPFVGEIRMFGGNFAPAGWAMCSGQLLPISQNDVLFSLIGTTYGGDGQNTFGLPDLRGRVPIHAGQGGGLQNYIIGQKAGAENVTITSSTMPTHTHPFVASTDVGDTPSGQGKVLSQSTSVNLYIEDAPDNNLSPNAIPGTVGGSQPHNNMMPFLTLTFIISLFGIYPSQN